MQTLNKCKEKNVRMYRKIRYARAISLKLKPTSSLFWRRLCYKPNNSKNVATLNTNDLYDVLGKLQGNILLTV